MANLDDLGYDSILDMTQDEALERLRQIRLARRIPSKLPKAVVEKKQQAKKVTDVTSDQAAQLLRLLGGSHD